jgi:hypothetical protein
MGRRCHTRTPGIHYILRSTEYINPSHPSYLPTALQKILTNAQSYLHLSPFNIFCFQSSTTQVFELHTPHPPHSPPTMPPQTHPPESAFTFLAQGALIQEFNVAGHNIVLGFPEASFYKTHNAPYFGETIGRTTNRIRDAKLHNLNGQTYRLAANDGPNCLHGGSQGWGKKDFEGPKPVNRHGKEGVEFRYVSKHMEEGYPGTVECKVWYMGSMEDGKTVLEVEYQVTFIGDECNETVVGVTNHRYAPPLPSLTSNPHS